MSPARTHVRKLPPRPRTHQRHNGHHLPGHARRRLRRRVALPDVAPPRLQPHRRLLRDRHGDAARARRLEMGHAVDGSGAALGDGGRSISRCPRRCRPDAVANRWMGMQGILEMAFGGGRWFTTPAAGRLCGAAARSPTPSTRARARARRDMRSPLRGELCIGPAPRWRWPEAVEVNGREY